MYRPCVMALCLLAGPVLAGNAPEAPEEATPRKPEVGLLEDVTVADRREVVRTRDVYDPWEAIMLGQEYVNQYVFENDPEALAREKGPREYR